MVINVLLIIFLLLILGCVVMGMNKGALAIIYSIIAWVFALWFINTASPIIGDIIVERTEMPESIQAVVGERVQVRYENAEEEENGTGLDAVLDILPEIIRSDIEGKVQDSVDILVAIVAEEITQWIIKVVSTILSILLAVLLIWLGKFCIKAIGIMPGIKHVNRFLGFLAGLFEALLIIFVILFLADCFNETQLGEFIIDQSTNNMWILPLYTHNPIEFIFS